MGVLTADPTGATAPIVETDSESLPSGFATQDRWTIGPVVIGGVTIESLKSISIDFGLQAVGEAADGDIWDTFHSVTTAQPIITMRGVDVEWLKAANIPLSGKVGTQANTTIYFRQRLTGGQYTPDGTAKHVKINVAAVIHIDDAFDGSTGGAAEASLSMRVYDDTTNDPFVIAIASAIT
jgi:hypothetical protein